MFQCFLNIVDLAHSVKFTLTSFEMCQLSKSIKCHTSKNNSKIKKWLRIWKLITIVTFCIYVNEFW